MTSVVIPVFNASGTIIKCLKSLESQISKPAEVIVVDDGSSDNTLKELSNFQKQTKLKIKIFKQKHLGPGAARNLGARKATGSVLAFIDSDCVPNSKWLANITDALSDPKIGAVGGGYCSGIDNSFWQKFSCEELKFRRRKIKKNVSTALSNNLACRKSLFWEAGGFPKEFPVCEDMFFTYQVSRNHKIIWLKNNGVKHHFKTSLISFLRHQYFFGRESTRFFLYNPSILKEGNHQGRELHVAIISSVFSLAFLILYYFSLQPVFFMTSIFFLMLHIFVYLKFVFYLKKSGFSKLNLVRAYLVSYTRDVVAAVSFFFGLALYINERKL